MMWTERSLWLVAVLAFAGFGLQKCDQLEFRLLEQQSKYQKLDADYEGLNIQMRLSQARHDLDIARLSLLNRHLMQNSR